MTIYWTWLETQIRYGLSKAGIKDRNGVEAGLTQVVIFLVVIIILAGLFLAYTTFLKPAVNNGSQNIANSANSGSFSG